MTFTKEQLTRIIESADEVITALAGTNDDIHPDNSTKMCAAWDDLNDRNAPPSVVKKLAEMALAGMEAEPVAECQHHWNLGGANKLQSQKQCVKCGRVELVEPQPATVVPDELSEDINDDEYPRAWGYRIGWNACRSAFIAASEGNKNDD